MDTAEYFHEHPMPWADRADTHSDLQILCRSQTQPANNVQNSVLSTSLNNVETTQFQHCFTFNTAQYINGQSEPWSDCRDAHANVGVTCRQMPRRNIFFLHNGSLTLKGTGYYSFPPRDICYYFRIAFLHSKPLLNGRKMLPERLGVYYKRKEFAPCGSKFFPFTEDPFSEGKCVWRRGKGPVVQENKQDITKAFSLKKNGGKSTKCIQFSFKNNHSFLLSIQRTDCVISTRWLSTCTY